MKIDEIREMAEVDLKIDRNDLSTASADAALLVNKYYLIYVDEVRILKMVEQKQLVLYKELYDYYLHFAPDEVYIEKPFNRKVLKGDVDMFISADESFININNKIESQKVKVKYLEEIIRQLNQRTFTVKNIIAFEHFRNGGY